MNEYIEREAAVKIAAKYGTGNGSALGKHSIDAIPAADVAPVVHGRRDDSGRYTFPGGATAVRCTECGCALTVSEYHLQNWYYCPVCGAKMDGGTEHDAEQKAAASR